VGLRLAFVKMRPRVRELLAECGSAPFAQTCLAHSSLARPLRRVRHLCCFAAGCLGDSITCSRQHGPADSTAGRAAQRGMVAGPCRRVGKRDWRLPDMERRQEGRRDDAGKARPKALLRAPQRMGKTAWNGKCGRCCGSATTNSVASFSARCGSAGRLTQAVSLVAGNCKDCALQPGGVAGSDIRQARAAALGALLVRMGRCNSLGIYWIAGCRDCVWDMEVSAWAA